MGFGSAWGGPALGRAPGPKRELGLSSEDGWALLAASWAGATPLVPSPGPWVAPAAGVPPGLEASCAADRPAHPSAASAIAVNPMYRQRCMILVSRFKISTSSADGPANA